MLSALNAPLLTAASLEQALGDPLDDQRDGSFRESVDADRARRFPERLCDAAFDWGLADHLVPVDCGGRLRSFEECFSLSRVLSRRDLTATIAIGANLLASIPVWLRGTAQQQHTVAELLRERAFLSFALSEEAHGSDILRNEVTASRGADGWRIDGTKWLINNAGHAAAATVAARSGTGVRGSTLFLLTRAAADDRRWTPLPEIPTHGLRGSAFGGLTFSNFPAADTDVIGRRGQGLEILLQTLQITRVLVGSFALGGLDTCLGAAVAFARSRRLYGTAIVELEPVARRLVDAYTELLIGETVALGACRAVQLSPDQLPLMSACAKYLVPQLAIDSIESLGVVLGARSYLPGGHWHGIFEKMRRDCAVTALFDGSSPVNLGVIVDHLPALAEARAAGGVDRGHPALFAPSAPPLPWLDDLDLELATSVDAVHGGIAAARDALHGERAPDGHREELSQLLDRCDALTRRWDDAITQRTDDVDWRRSGEAYDLAVGYSHLHAAGACCWKWLAWREQSTDPFVTSGAWLVLCLRRLMRRLDTAQAPLDDVDRAALRRLHRFRDGQHRVSDFDRPLDPHLRGAM